MRKRSDERVSNCGTQQLRSDSTEGPGGLEPLLLTVEQAAHVLSINRSTLYDLLGRGELPSVKIGRRRLISKQALVVFIDRRERETMTP